VNDKQSNYIYLINYRGVNVKSQVDNETKQHFNVQPCGSSSLHEPYIKHTLEMECSHVTKTKNNIQKPPMYSVVFT